MTDQLTELYTAAHSYYVEGETMETIARDMGVSRSTVSRMLSRARENGVVRISLVEPPASQSRLAAKISSHFNVKVHLVEVPDEAPIGARLRSVTSYASQILSALIFNGARLGIAWGVTVAHMARQMTPRHMAGVQVVQMNGSAHAKDTGLPYVGSILQAFAEAFNGTVVPFTVPAFFDHVETRRLMWQERSVKLILEELEQLDLAVFGVGALTARVPSHVYSSGYLSAGEVMRAQRQGAVGDVCTILIREDGSYDNIDLNERATGMTPDQLARIPRRMCVVGDPSRARVLLGALRSGAVSDLVCDGQTAKNLLSLI